MDTSGSRRDAVAAFEAAVDAVRPGRLLPQVIRVRNGRPAVGNEPFPPAPGRRVVASLGKAGPGLAAAWLRLLPGWADALFVLTPHGVPVPPEVERAATVRRGAHPIPDTAGEAAARELLDLVGGLGQGDLLVVLLSGGTSALLAAPEPPLTLEAVVATTRALLRAGAPIGALNTVRRQLLRAGGGGLARTAFPAFVVTLVLSDVPGDPLPDIASGPTVPSPTTATDALAVLARHGVLDRVPPSVPELLKRLAGVEKDRDRRWTARSRTVIIGNNQTAVRAAEVELGRRGWDVWRLKTPLLGEASIRGRQLGALARAVAPSRPFAAVFGGETTVTVRGDGRGGRNQELALAAALELEGGPPRLLLAAGTDGIDGLSDAAGAVVDPGTAERVRRAGMEPRIALQRNDSGTALAAAGDALVTGPTGTNVCDVTVLLAPEP